MKILNQKLADSRSPRDPSQKKPKEDKEAKIKEELAKNKQKLSQERKKIYGLPDNKQPKKTKKK